MRILKRSPHGRNWLPALCAVMCGASMAQAAVPMGSGSYLTEFPGTDEAGRNAVPTASPNVSGHAAAKPLPTSDWWTAALTNPIDAKFFNYPMAFHTLPSGLVMIKPIMGQGVPADNPVTIGLKGLSAESVPVVDYSDWTVRLRWGNEGNCFYATIGQCMPFVYFTKDSSAPVQVNVAMGSVTVKGNVAVVKGSFNNASYALYAPSGSTWELNGTTLTSDLGGKNYWSAALLPDGGDADVSASEWAKYAFTFPTDTQAIPSYCSSNATVTTTYDVTRDVKEGSDNGVLLGLMPHQWANINGAEPSYLASYATARGEMKVAAIKDYSTTLKFSGILPMLPAAMTDENGYTKENLSKLVKKVASGHGLSDWTDSYNDGQLLNRLVQTGNAAYAAGDTEGFNQIYTLVKERLERWLTAADGDKAFVFYYHKPWNSLLAYPAGHYMDSGLNDHHFHYGYFITAAAFLAQHDSSWAEKWGPMVNMLVDDAACIDRDNEMFPYLRNFSPYSGHAWASGLPTVGSDTNQESSSESMMFNSALILWAEATGNKELLNAAVWMYTTERSAIDEYWFDAFDRNHAESFKSALASRVFINGYDDSNFWGAPISGSYGIQVYPVQPSSTYLVENPNYAEYLWNAMKSETDIMTGTSSDGNVWYDAWIQHLAMIDPDAAIALYNKSLSKLGAKFGASRALTYYWVASMAATGTPEQSVTSDHPLANAFRKSDTMTYCAYNYSDSPMTVTFSDGHTLKVDARSSAFDTSKTTSPKPSYFDKATGQIRQATLYTGTNLVLENPDLVVPKVTEAAPTPTHAADEVKSIYSGAYTSVTPDMTIGNWNQSTVVEKTECGGDEAMLLNDFNYLGFELMLNGGTVDMSDMGYIHLDVYSPIDMELGVSAISFSPTVEKKATRVITAGKWNSLEIALKELNGVGFRNLGQLKLDGGSGQAVYLDNIYFHKGEDTPDTPENPEETEVPAAPTPTREAANVKGIYSGAYTSVVPGMFFAQWGGTDKIDEVECSGDKATKATGFKWMGIQFANDGTIDVSDMDHIHVDLYSPEEMDANIYPISLNPTFDAEKSAMHIEAGKWNSYDIPMTEFPNVDFKNLGQFKFDNGSGQTLYVDNLYLYKEGSETDPENPGNGDGNGDDNGETTPDTYTGTDASEGSFKAPWTVSFTPNENSTAVTITATFDDLSAYVGFAGPWMHDLTEGFAEHVMSPGQTRSVSYIHTKEGLTPGQTVKVRVKIAYAGGLGVTPDLLYTVPVPTGASLTEVEDSFTVHTLQGVTLLRNVPTSELTRLHPGLYIINGRKVRL